jgi:hypothetical protein
MPALATPISIRPSPAPCASMATTGTATCLARTRPPTSTATRSSRLRRSRTETPPGPSPSISATRARSTRISAFAAISASHTSSSGSTSTCTMCSTRRLREHPDQHHRREFRQGQLSEQRSTCGADQGATGVLIRKAFRMSGELYRCAVAVVCIARRLSCSTLKSSSFMYTMLIHACAISSTVRSPQPTH